MVYNNYYDLCDDLNQKLDLTPLQKEVEKKYQQFCQFTPKKEVVIFIRTTADTKRLVENKSGKLG